MMEQKGTTKDQGSISRRDLLRGAGAIAAGGAFAAAGGTTLVGMAEASKQAGGAIYPWKYAKIDPDKAAMVAYNNWYRNFCSYGAASGIIVPQRELVGGPWNSFPLMALKFGEGGVEGWGTLCGCLLGGSVAISLAAGHDGKPMINDLMQWYSETMQPVFKPKKPRARFKSKTVSGSPLCHISVGKWMKAEGKSLGSAERRDRCARLTASVSYKIATMLNDWADGKYKPSYTNKQSAVGITTQNNCTGCHGSDVPSPI
ncbi:MAG: C_GCAxxG_C_C family protein [Thermodesulfovibrionales bacterium]|nr:C_GCAxxG_C_C family protein [Thermodesulfovibrionales bacterium]